MNPQQKTSAPSLQYFFDAPVIIDADLRLNLEAFDARNPAQSWSWFVQGTKIISERDFAILTRREP